MASRAQSTLLDIVAAALHRGGVGPSSLVLAGVSGGADSVAMLSALVELRGRFGYRLAAAHLNHRMRAAESDRDERFVRELCAQLGVELIVGRAGGLAPGGPNLEERAREARHAFLVRTADERGASHIALAHHADDQAETVLMRLLRGTGASGLAAMAERGPGRIIRPMLTLGRAAILAYLDAGGLGHIEDSSNQSPSFLRNRVRRELLPMLEREYAPGISRRLVELAGEMRSLDELATSTGADELNAALTAGGALDLTRFASLHPAVQAAMLRLFVERRVGSLRRFARAHVESLRRLCLGGPPNGLASLPGGWRAIREYHLLRIVHDARRRAEPARHFEVELLPSGTTIVEAAGFAFDGETLARCDARMPASPFAALFDVAKLGVEPLMVRNFVAGDRIAPIGIAGTRKVKDVFIDRKLSRARRAVYPIVTLGGEIAWLPGLLRGRIAAVSSATETVLKIEARPFAV